MAFKSGNFDELGMLRSAPERDMLKTSKAVYLIDAAARALV